MSVQASSERKQVSPNRKAALLKAREEVEKLQNALLLAENAFERERISACCDFTLPARMFAVYEEGDEWYVEKVPPKKS